REVAGTSTTPRERARTVRPIGSVSPGADGPPFRPRTRRTPALPRGPASCRFGRCCPEGRAGSGPAGHRGDDRDGVAVGRRGGQAVAEAHVVVGDVEVDEAVQGTLAVEDATGEAGVGSLEVVEHLVDGGALDADLGRTGGEGAEGGGHADG